MLRRDVRPNGTGPASPRRSPACRTSSPACWTRIATTGRGRCRACTTPGRGTPNAAWPCGIAADRRAGRRAGPGTGSRTRSVIRWSGPTARGGPARRARAEPGDPDPWWAFPAGAPVARQPGRTPPVVADPSPGRGTRSTARYPQSPLGPGPRSTAGRTRGEPTAVTSRAGQGVSGCRSARVSWRHRRPASVRRRLDRSAAHGTARLVAGRLITALAALLVLAVLTAPIEINRVSPEAFLRIPLEGLAGVALLLVLPGRARRWVGRSPRRAAGPGGHLEDPRSRVPGGARPAVRPGTGLDPVRRRGELPHRLDRPGRRDGRRAGRRAARRRAARADGRRGAAAVPTTGPAPGDGGPRGRRVDRDLDRLCGARRPLVPGEPLADRNVSALAYDRAQMVRAGILDQEAFAAEAAVDTFRGTPGDQLLTGLRGKDVHLRVRRELRAHRAGEPGDRPAGRARAGRRQPAS